MSLLDRLDAAWTRLEVALCVGVVALLVGALTAWVALKGLSSRTTDTFVAGVVFRALTGALALGTLSRLATRKRPERLRNLVTTAAVVVGLAASWLWRDAGVGYFGNLLGWLQDGSTLTLVGGLRGLGTRLTLWLALLGASLATASGRHVSIDVVTRALGDAVRAPLSRLGGVVAAAVCLFAAWGFFDFIALDAFRAPANAGAASKLEVVGRGLSNNLFLARRQLLLDARMAGRVLAGAPWDRSLTAAEWNEWLDAGDFTGHFGAAVAAGLREAGDGTRAPLLSVPGEASRGLLVKTLDLIIPFGLLVVALRFLLHLLRGSPTQSAHGGDAPRAGDTSAAGSPGSVSDATQPEVGP